MSILYILLATLTLDLFSKYTANNYLIEKIKIFWDLFYLDVYKNTGIAFSIPLEWILLKIITISLIIGIFYYYFKEEKNKNSKLVDISFWLILGWAIWNWVERIFFSEVTDFIWVKYFAVFNLADSFITIWVMLYIYSLYIKQKDVKLTKKT